MSNKKFETEKNMLDRLNEVAAHFKKRDDICEELALFTQTDYNPASPKCEDLTRLITRIQEEELIIFSHIVSLKTDVERLFEAFGFNKRAIGMIFEFKPFKIAEKFVNEQATGWQNKPKLVKQQYAFVASSQSSKASIQAFISFLVCNKDIYPSIELIRDLIRIWIFFLEEHAEVNVENFLQKYTAVLNRDTVYSKYVPKKIFEHFKENLRKKGLPAQRELVVIEKEIKERFSSIVSIFEELDELRSNLSKFTLFDTYPAPAKNEKLEKLLFKIKRQEVAILSELVHLKDNTIKYMRVSGRNKAELEVIDEFKPYRIASNFVNAHKHGTSGKNRPSAKIDYSTFYFKQTGSNPAPNDPLIGMSSIINYAGDLRQTEKLIMELMFVWRLFFKYHMEIDVESFNDRIRAVSECIQKTSFYSCVMPKGLLDDAKYLSDERKGLDI